MRVATWNLAGRWSDAHAALIQSLDADVLLLTEVSDRLVLPDYSVHRTSALMAPRRTWAAVASRAPMRTLRDPHPATAMVSSSGWTFASSILPWRSCGDEPWGEGRHVDKTRRTVDVLLDAFPRDHLVWGGDWNHALQGKEYAGSIGGRTSLLSAVTSLALTVPTIDLRHRIDGLFTIDHLAVPSGASANAVRVEATSLSDHDAYAVTLED